MASTGGSVLVFGRSALAGADGGKDTLVEQLAAEVDFRVAGAFDLRAAPKKGSN